MEETIDKRYGYGFKVINTSEQILLGASTDVDRSSWVTNLLSVIHNSKDYLKDYLIILPGSNILMNSSSTSGTSKYFKLNSSQPSNNFGRKYVILAEDVLTFHPDMKQTATIEGAMQLTTFTSKIEEINDHEKIIAIVDNDPLNNNDSTTNNDGVNRVILQFNTSGNTITDDHMYKQWKQRLTELLNHKVNQQQPESDDLSVKVIIIIKNTDSCFDFLFFYLLFLNNNLVW